jgi:hydrogenase maturation protease
MNLGMADQIAKAILYEGYMLYPYRASSVKNKQRWNFGVLYPSAYAEAQSGSDASMSQTECLVAGAVMPALEIRVRFLQLVERSIGKYSAPIAETERSHSTRQSFKLVERLEVGGKTHQPWQEAVEREISLHLMYGDTLTLEPALRQFNFPAGKEIELLRNEANRVPGVIVREYQTLNVGVEVVACLHGNDLFRITLKIKNLTAASKMDPCSRDQALAFSLLSAHAVLGVKNGKFISLLEPPDEFASAVSACSNVGTWPVLVGKEGESDTLLSSPIILYDYPQIAPESAGDLFDGTEIDEILSLRIMTLTDEEKREMRASDDKTRQILERTEALPPEQFMKLHGVVRALRPQKENAS